MNAESTLKDESERTQRLYREIKQLAARQGLISKEDQITKLNGLVESIFCQLGIDQAYPLFQDARLLVLELLTFEDLVLVEDIDWTDARELLDHLELQEILENQHCFILNYPEATKYLEQTIVRLLRELLRQLPIIPQTEKKSETGSDLGLFFSKLSDAPTLFDIIFDDATSTRAQELGLFYTLAVRLFTGSVLISKFGAGKGLASPSDQIRPSEAGIKEPEQLFRCFFGVTPWENFFSRIAHTYETALST